MHPRLLVADDGFTWLAGWSDTERNIQCGRMDSSIDACGGVQAMSVDYADDACTKPIVSVAEYSRYAWFAGPSGDVAGYELNSDWYFGPHYVQTANGCGARTTPLSGQPFLAHATNLLEVSSTTTLMTPTNAPWSIVRRTWHDGGYELSLRGPLPATREWFGNTRLQWIAVKAETYTVPYAIRDTQRGEDCTPVSTEQGIRCLPLTLEEVEEASSRMVFDNPQCTHATNALVATDRPALVMDLTGQADHVIYPTAVAATGTFYQRTLLTVGQPGCVRIDGPVVAAQPVALDQFAELTEIAE